MSKKKLARHIILLSVFLISLLGLLVLVPLSREAQAAAPSKLRVDDVQYDPGSQQFVIDLSCQAGMAGAADKAGFRVGIEFTVNIGQGDDYLNPSEPAVELASAIKDSEGMVKLEPIYIPWSSDLGGGEYFEGIAIVTTKAVLQNRQGKNIGSAFVDITRYIQIEAP